MSTIKRIDAKEFQEVGFLQEANRLFFHPHGLALEVIANKPDEDWTYTAVAVEHLQAVLDFFDGEPELSDVQEAFREAIEKGGKVIFGGCWDYRDDPEGMCFGNAVDEDKIARVEAELLRHASTRLDLFGGTIIQPSGWEYPKDSD